ncbi:hypothetical protein [Amorphus sp. MBR-141]
MAGLPVARVRATEGRIRQVVNPGTVDQPLPYAMSARIAPSDRRQGRFAGEIWTVAATVGRLHSCFPVPTLCRYRAPYTVVPTLLPEPPVHTRPPLHRDEGEPDRAGLHDNPQE